jgi:hypothetical protein
MNIRVVVSILPTHQLGLRGSSLSDKLIDTYCIERAWRKATTRILQRILLFSEKNQNAAFESWDHNTDDR